MHATHIGIDQISFYTANFYLDLAILAKRNQIDIGKYHFGIGQEKMSVAPHDEDVVTLGANAALPIIEKTGKENITGLFFATETGIDQSKSAGVYVHRLLNLNSNCRVVELKQACYSATAALHMACALVARNPNDKILVIAADIARYDLNSAAEPTQGCGAVAMLISQNPRILSIDPQVGNYTEDVMDFWRPNYRKTALVDGKFSTDMYLKAVCHAWQNYQNISPLQWQDFQHFCYHLPFSRMGVKAHRHLCAYNQQNLSEAQLERQLNAGLLYNRVIGNSYTAALYISLVSLLDNHPDDLTGRNIGLCSYGSGCVAEFFRAVVMPDYRQQLFTQSHQKMLAAREALDYDQYLAMWHYPDPQTGEAVENPLANQARFRLAGIDGHQRRYQG